MIKTRPDSDKYVKNQTKPSSLVYSIMILIKNADIQIEDVEGALFSNTRFFCHDLILITLDCVQEMLIVSKT